MINPNKRKRDESQQEIDKGRPHKKVRWDSSVQENTIENRSLFYKRPVKPINVKDIVELFYLYFQKDDREACVQELSRIQKKCGGWDNVFSEAIDILVYTTILFYMDHKLLSFIFSVTPINYIRDALSNKNQLILHRYSLSPKGKKEAGIYTSEMEQNRIKIWSMLLEIAPDDVDDFMQKYFDVPEESQLEYKQALKNFSNEKPEQL